jgi:hypothetical protein
MFIRNRERYTYSVSIKYSKDTENLQQPVALYIDEPSSGVAMWRYLMPSPDHACKGV